MLPIILTENINYSVDGVSSIAPIYRRTFLACDGAALIGKSGQPIEWNLEIRRRQLMGKLISAVAEAGVRGYLSNTDVEEMAITPIATAATEDGPGKWKALLVHIPSQEQTLNLSQNGNIDSDFAAHSAVFAEKFQAKTGCECTVLTGQSEFKGAAEFFNSLIEKSQHYSNDDLSGVFQKTGQTICAPLLLTDEIASVLKSIEPALTNSLLHQNTRAIDPSKSQSSGIRI